MYETPYDALVPFGWGPRVHALFSDVLKAADTVPGRVTRSERDFCRVVSEDGEVLARSRARPGDAVAA